MISLASGRCFICEERKDAWTYLRSGHYVCVDCGPKGEEKTMTINTCTVEFTPFKLTTIRFNYVNYRMEREQRTAAVHSFFYGSSSYHQGSQWFMHAMDLDRKEFRDFAVRDMTDVVEISGDRPCDASN